MRHFLSTVAIVMVAVSYSPAQHSPQEKTIKPSPVTKNLADMINQVRNSVVRVEAEFPNGKSSGTGFFVNTDGVVVTARHVIYPPGVTQPPQRVVIEVRMPTVESEHINVIGSWNDFTANVIAVDEVHDIAVLKPLRNPFPAIMGIKIGDRLITTKPLAVTFDPHLLRDGEAIFTSGYPLNLTILITTSGFIASSDPITMEPEVPGRRSPVQDYYWADIHANPGNSGGPLFSMASGAVIGMVVKYEDSPVIFSDLQQQGYGAKKSPDGTTIEFHPLISNSGIAIVLPAKYIDTLLSGHSILYEVNKGN